MKTYALAFMSLVLSVFTVWVLVTGSTANADQRFWQPWKKPTPGHWYRHEDYDPKWEQFKEDHPEKEFHTMTIWRGNQKEVIRFWRDKR